jgi:ATP-dependent RNA helicase RhlE
MTFREFGLGTEILRSVTEAGYETPTPIQLAAIPPILKDQDVIGIAQTGTGKTAAFVLPMLEKLRTAPPSATGSHGHAHVGGTSALILAPTRELVVQIAENAQIYGRYLPLKIATVFGGVGENPQIQALRHGVDIIVATPGRLLDLMDRGNSRFSHLRFLVLDEADRMLDMGFLPSIQRIVRALPRRRQTLLFSATLSKDIEELTHEFLRHPQRIEIGRRTNPADTVKQVAHEVPAALKSTLLIHLLQSNGLRSVLVFSRTKHGADRLAKKLHAQNIPTAALHSDRSQSQRLRALRDFKEGKVRVLVATDIAARGIDVDGISHVINYDFPMHPEDYVHRIGRTGRAQAIGDAISFVTPEDRDALRGLERFIGRNLVKTRVENFDYAQRPEAHAPDRSRQSHHTPSHSKPSSHSGSHSNPRSGSHPGSQRQGQSSHSRPAAPRGGGHNRPREVNGNREGGNLRPSPSSTSGRSASGRPGGSRGRTWRSSR